MDAVFSRDRPSAAEPPKRPRGGRALGCDSEVIVPGLARRECSGPVKLQLRPGEERCTRRARSRTCERAPLSSAGASCVFRLLTY